MLNLLKRLKNSNSQEKLVYKGLNSKVLHLDNGNIKKIFIRKKELKYRVEIKCLKALSQYNFFPKIIRLNKNKFEIEMTFCGENINKFNLPLNWREQVYQIKDILDQMEFVQADIELHNICVKDDQIYIIDFGSNRFYFDEFFSNQKLQPEWLAKFDVSPMEKYQIYKNKKHRRLEEIILNLVTR